MEEKLIIDFKDPAEDRQWEKVNDVVMGGLSRSRITIDGGTAVFQGEVSLENYGGFASVRSLPRNFGLEGYHQQAFTIKFRKRGCNNG